MSMVAGILAAVELIFEEIKWVTLDTIPEPLHSGWKFILPKIIDNIKKILNK